MHDVVFVIPDVLNGQEIEALRYECDHSRKSMADHDGAELGLSLDLFEDKHVSEFSKIRVDSNAYFDCRWSESMLSNIQKHTIKDILLQKLPNLVRTLLGNYDKERSTRANGLYLFNEHYVVKESNSNIIFKWHCDQDEQLASLLMLQESSPQSKSSLPIYYSCWCPLDDVYSDNGTIYFPPHTQIKYISKADLYQEAYDSIDPIERIHDDNDDDKDDNTIYHNRRMSSLITPHLVCHNTDDDSNPKSSLQYDDSSSSSSSSSSSCSSSSSTHQSLLIDDQYRNEDSSSFGGNSIPIITKAGSVIVFSSVMWHMSTCNNTTQPRRVYYAQYSTEIIYASYRIFSTSSSTVDEVKSERNVLKDNIILTKRTRDELEKYDETDDQTRRNTVIPLCYAIPCDIIKCIE